MLILLLLLLLPSSSSQCLTGNPIDDCFLCSPTDRRSNRFHLADCSIGFGRSALGGKNGLIYTVTDPSDSDPADPLPGTLRHAAIQFAPLWIIFASSMSIHLNQELLVNSFKTIDGRGAEIHIAGGACITLQNVSNVIIHNLHIHDCVPAGDAVIRSSPIEADHHGKSDGDAISIVSSKDIWIDHCDLSNCTDGLIDVTMGSTRVTISNNFFSRHDKVMLLGHSDEYAGDLEMQVTVAYNRFGEKLVQRMPRCRHGYFHIVNNDYTEWEMYAVGGTANPTINSQGNRYTAPADPNSKEVTKRIEIAEEQWSSWNWRSDGDIMANGAFFVPSGARSPAMYEKATSVDAKPAELIDQLTLNAGVLSKLKCDGPDGGGEIVGGGGGGGGGGDSKFPGMGFRGGSPPPLFVSFSYYHYYLFLLMLLEA